MPSEDAPDLEHLETVDGRRVPVRVRVNPRASRISVRIDPSRGEAVLIAPSTRQVSRALAFAHERAGWIAGELARIPPKAPFAPGGLAPLRGVMHQLKRAPGRGAAQIEAGEPPMLVLPMPASAVFEARVRRYFEGEAAGDLRARVAAHAATLNVRPAAVQIKDTRTRWGSCSSEGVLSFSWRVILAPPFVLDYLAAHEVAHLREMNHGPRFWACVRRCVPGHAAGRAWLRAHGATLHRYGARPGDTDLDIEPDV
jgi:predicted metal-dependent hydrolase